MIRRALARIMGTAPTGTRARGAVPTYKPVPAQPFIRREAEIIDGAFGTPPLRNLDTFTRDVTPRREES